MKSEAQHYVPLIKASLVDAMRGKLSRVQLNHRVDSVHNVLDANKFNGMVSYGYAIDGIHTEQYSKYFHDVERAVSHATGLRGMESILRKLKRENGGIIHAADFMGRGLFIRNHPNWHRHITSMTGVSYVVPNNDWWDNTPDNSLNTQVVSADLYTYEGWGNLACAMKSTNIPAFQIAWCRPAGPFNRSVGHSWDYIHAGDLDYLMLDMTDFYAYMLGYMDKEHSLLLTQLPVQLGAHSKKVAHSISEAGYNVHITDQTYRYQDITMAVWRGLD